MFFSMHYLFVYILVNDIRVASRIRGFYKEELLNLHLMISPFLKKLSRTGHSLGDNYVNDVITILTLYLILSHTKGTIHKKQRLTMIDESVK